MPLFGRRSCCAVVTLLIPLLFGCGWVLAQSGDRSDPTPVAAFAALDIVSAGAQIFDITTGRTELPDGGDVIDSATGIRLTATYIVFVEGEIIEATGVEVSGSLGLLLADEMTIDIAAAMLIARGDISLVRDALTLRASEVEYDAAAEIAIFVGPVLATAPDFEARALLLDTVSGTALLLGPYRFQNGPLTLTSNRNEGRLELLVELVDQEPRYRAATEVAPATLARFADHLP